jgi:hypothetical protein
MQVAYCLKDNPKHIAEVQKATLTTDEFGIEPTDGLFGSPEWWDRIAGGALPLHTLSGTITGRFMGSMGDWPMIRVLSDAGEQSSWTREVNREEQDALYRVGRHIEIDYVLQKHRGKSWARNPEHHKVVLEIRVEPDAEGEVPGAYEKLLAQEIAHRVLTAPILYVGEASYRLAELGRIPGVMSHEVHRVFASARTELESLIGGRQIADSEERKQFDRKMADIEARWKDKVIAACRKIVGEHIS